MDALIALVKLVTALVLLATAILKLQSEAIGSTDRDDKEEGR